MSSTYASNAVVGVTWYGTASSPGTFGQGGNAWEWDDAVIDGSSRGLRGSAWDNAHYYMASSFRDGFDFPWVEYKVVGFRVASVPEPASSVLGIFASGLLMIRRRR